MKYFWFITWAGAFLNKQNLQLVVKAFLQQIFKNTEFSNPKDF